MAKKPGDGKPYMSASRSFHHLFGYAISSISNPQMDHSLKYLAIRAMFHRGSFSRSANTHWTFLDIFYSHCAEPSKHSQNTPELQRASEEEVANKTTYAWTHDHSWPHWIATFESGYSIGMLICNFSVTIQISKPCFKPLDCEEEKGRQS